jgi:hypothetical protein
VSGHLNTFRAMIELGLTDEQKLALIAAMEADAKPKDATASVRQQRRRDKVKAERDASRVTSREDGSPYEDTSTPSGTDLIDEASASSPVRQPITAARDIWNENAAQAGWGTITTLSATRTKSLGSRLREHGLEGWRAGIARARASPYLGGADPPSWFKFDWLIKAGNFLKLIEGNYDRNRSDKPVSSWGSARDSVRLHGQ